MSTTISAAFATRRDAEMVVEHLVQEHGLRADAVEIVPATTQNSAGTKLAGSDKDEDRQNGSPQLNGTLIVIARVSAENEEGVKSSFADNGGRLVGDPMTR